MKRNTVKNAARFIGSMAVGTLTGLLVKQNVVPSSTYEKIAVGIGSFILSDMVSVKAEDHIDTQIDKIFDTVDEVKNNIENKEEKQEVVVQKYEESKVEE